MKIGLSYQTFDLCHFNHSHVAIVSAKASANAPPNSDNSERAHKDFSKQRIDSNQGSQGTSLGNSNRTAIHLKLHSRSSSCSDMKQLYKTPKTLSPTECSLKSSPVKPTFDHRRRTLSLDLSSIVDGASYGHKRTDITRLRLQTRIAKAELKRLYWEDLREDKQALASMQKAAELAEFKQTHQIEIEHKKRLALEKREEKLRYKSWLAEKAQENKAAKEGAIIERQRRDHDDCSRSVSFSVLNSQAKAALKKRFRQEEEDRRQHFKEEIELKYKQRALKSDALMREHRANMKKRLDELFDKTLQENRESMNKLMTAKYARKQG